MGNISLSFVYSSGFTLTANRISFKACLNLALSLPNAQDIVYVKAVSTKKTMLYDESLFSDFLKGFLSLPELIELTECDAVYRNIMNCQFKSFNIDSGSLWVLRSGKYELVDDDQFVSVTFPDNNFELI